jgi:hypothetical protein
MDSGLGYWQSGESEDCSNDEREESRDDGEEADHYEDGDRDYSL